MKEKKWLLPPWLAFPYIERYSIGWRWGDGESYAAKWGPWYDSLAPEEAEKYRELFPEPVIWKGYWDDEDECSYYENGDFVIELWQDGGVPKYSVEQLRQSCQSGKAFSCVLFWGHRPSKDGGIGKSCFSQWWKASFRYEERTYCCMEQYMMAKKAELFGDEEIHSRIMDCEDPKQIKSLGRKVRHFDEAVWDEVKYSIVLNGNFHKFFQNRRLRDFLLSTGDSILAEASPYDGIWGIRMSAQDENANDPVKWRGSNLLGFALMEVRDELRRICANENAAS